jgi:NTE family protein
LVDTAPLHKLVRETIQLEFLRQSSISLTVGAVNMADGEIVYANPAFPNFIDYVLASAAIPVIMPPVYIGDNKNQPFLDGGIRDVAPLKLAIRSGAEEIVCVLCHTKKLGGETFNPRNLMSLTERVMDIVVNELVNNDIKWATKFNKYLPDDGSKCFDGLLEGYRKVKITVIRPPSPINLNLEKFTTVDIQETIEAGYYAAMKEVG